MKNKSFFLITCGSEETWQFDKPIVFIGNWCRRFNRKHVWSKLDAIVAKPYGIDMKQKEIDFLYINELVEGFIGEIAIALNNYHHIDKSVRYWRILIGHWLARCFAMLYNRYQTLKQTIELYDIGSTIFFKADNEVLATYDTRDIIQKSHDDIFNNILYAMILNCLDNSQIDTIYIGLDNCVCKRDNLKGRRNFYNHLKEKMFSLPQKHSKYFIASSYLPRMFELKLHLLLKQIPYRLNERVETIRTKIDIAAREELREHSLSSDNKGFDRFIRNILWYLFPISLLEGYRENLDRVKNLSWPLKPKVIFTSNKFDHDDMFQLYTAEKTEHEGTKYLIGQHGNNYGTYKFNYCEKECLSVCDKFISWGWRNEIEKVKPAFIFKTCGKRQKYDRKGFLLLVEKCLPERVETWDVFSEFGDYMKEQLEFYRLLPNYIREKTIVRFQKRNFNPTEYSEELRWKEKYPNANYDSGTAGINKLISKSRLVIHSYDSTGTLETLSLNIPTLCFWRNGLDDLVSSARPYYQKMFDIGIFHNSPLSLVKTILRIWGNPTLWWETPAVQTAVKEFCNKYARNVRNPLNMLRDIIAE